MIKEYFLKTFHHWRILFKDRAFLASFFLGIFVLGSAGLVDHAVSTYHDSHVYTSVGDLILNKIPTYNLEFLFFWGLYTIVGMIILYCCFVEPEMGPFTLKTFGVLLLVRSGFIVLTFIGPPQGFYFVHGVEFENFFKDMFFKNDLFFSGHTAVPFLAYFLYRKRIWFRILMLLSSFMMGATVLLMHVHYSIDVFAAFFITYGIYAFSNKIFNQLNLRFARRIKLYGWKSLQKRIKKLKERQLLKRFLK